MCTINGMTFRALPCIIFNYMKVTEPEVVYNDFFVIHFNDLIQCKIENLSKFSVNISGTSTGIWTRYFQIQSSITHSTETLGVVLLISAKNIQHFYWYRKKKAHPVFLCGRIRIIKTCDTRRNKLQYVQSCECCLCQMRGSVLIFYSPNINAENTRNWQHS